MSELDAAHWIDTLTDLRAGFPRFTSAGRATAVATACLILDKFAVEPATGKWVLAIQAGSRLAHRQSR